MPATMSWATYRTSSAPTIWKVPELFYQHRVRRHLPRVGQLFELHRGLPLVIYAVPVTDNGGHGVEKHTMCTSMGLSRVQGM